MSKRSFLERVASEKFALRRGGRKALTKDPRSRGLLDAEIRNDAARMVKERQWNEYTTSRKRVVEDGQSLCVEYLNNVTSDGISDWYGCDLTFMMWDLALNCSILCMLLLSIRALHV